ncbi:MAG: SprB repeat-containing protein, partial [Bacteroidota bacterium]
MKKIVITTKILIISFVIFWIQLSGTENPKKKWEIKNVFNDGVFIKNEGQFNSIKGHQILFKDLRDNIYFTEKGLIFEVKEIKKEEKGFFKKEEEFVVKKQHCAYEFLDCNSNIKTELFELQKEGYYTFQNSKNFFKGYKKLIYYNVWDRIDVEFVIQDKEGIKYNIIVHPGADISKIKIKIHAKQSPKIDEAGNLLIKTFIGKNIIDHKPIAFQNNKNIHSDFHLNNNILTFNIKEYNNQSELIIDPWVIVPSALPSNTGYDVDYDQNGNVYISSPTMMLAKYNSAGAFQWLYNGSSGSGYFSEFCTLPSGSTLWGEGFNAGGARIYKISANGALQITAGPFSTREVWTIFYNRCSGQVLGFGGGTSDMNNLQIVNDTNLTGGTIKNYNGYTGSCCNDVVDAIIDVNGDFFAVQVTGAGPDKLHKCAGPAYNPPLLFDVNLGYGYEECNCFTFPAIPLSTNRANVLALNSSYLFTYGGRTIKVWNKASGAMIASQVVNASYVDGVLRTCDGIVVDECNNVYVGGMNNIHGYHFDGSSFSALPNISTPGAVYDLALDEANGILYAVGNGFLGAYSVPTNISFSLSMVPGSCGACDGIINIANTSTCTSTGFIFNVMPGNITTTNTSVPNLCAQLYTVAANLGCRGKVWEDTITVTSNTSGITVSFNVNNPLCYGGTGSATVMPYNASYGYTWQPSVGSGTLGTNLPIGIYTVNVSNGASCSGSGTFQIVQPSSLNVVVSATNISCNGGNNGAATCTASGGAGGYTYTWAPSGG